MGSGGLSFSFEFYTMIASFDLEYGSWCRRVWFVQRVCISLSVVVRCGLLGWVWARWGWFGCSSLCSGYWVFREWFLLVHMFGSC